MKSKANTKSVIVSWEKCWKWQDNTELPNSGMFNFDKKPFKNIIHYHFQYHHLFLFKAFKCSCVSRMTVRQHSWYLIKNTAELVMELFQIHHYGNIFANSNFFLMQAKRIKKSCSSTCHIFLQISYTEQKLHIAINHCLKAMSCEPYFLYVLHVRLFVKGMSKLSEKME